jgi:hypothetical protein
MPEKKFELGDYVEVKDRIAIFYELYPSGRLCTAHVEMLTAPDETQRVMVTAEAYRTPDDPHPGVGTSWMLIPGATPYTRGSEVENTETSAWGRAIASLGILIDRSIASGQEVANKRDDGPAGAAAPSPQPPDDGGPYRETEELLGDYSGSGMVRLGGGEGYKLEARDGPTGHVIGFRMEFKDDKAIPQVIVEGPAGEALYLATSMNPGAIRDTRLFVKGRLSSVKSNRQRQSWKRLRVVEWSNNEFTYPAPDEPKLPEPPEEIALPFEAAS